MKLLNICWSIIFIYFWSKRLSIFAFVCWLFIIGFLCFTNFCSLPTCLLLFCLLLLTYSSYLYITNISPLLFTFFAQISPKILCLLAVLTMFWLFTYIKLFTAKCLTIFSSLISGFPGCKNILIFYFTPGILFLNWNLNSIWNVFLCRRWDKDLASCVSKWLMN